MSQLSIVCACQAQAKPMIINPYTTNGNFAWHSLSICQQSLSVCQHSLTLVITCHPLMVAQPHVQIYKRGANQAQRDSSEAHM